MRSTPTTSSPDVTRYSAAGLACTARITSSPEAGRDRRRRASSVRATASTGTHGRRSAGTAAAAAASTSADQAARSASPRPARARLRPGLGAAALRLGQRGAGGHGEAPAGPAGAGRSAGSRRLIRASRIAWPAPCHRVSATSSMKTRPNGDRHRSTVEQRDQQ